MEVGRNDRDVRFDLTSGEKYTPLEVGFVPTTDLCAVIKARYAPVS
jgi:hypothetical protein